MNKIIVIIQVLLLLLFFQANAQIDSLQLQTNNKKSIFKKNIVPISLIASGVLISGGKFEKSFQKDIRNIVGNEFNYKIDNYTRSFPIIQLYAADILGVKAKNHWFDQTKNLTMSILLTEFITYKLKRITNKKRPNASLVSGAMPSGHTSFAFANATVLKNEFRHSSSFLVYSGYAFATTTGIFRVLNNAHWISDVLVGAGIGILVTELIYFFDPIIKWNPFKKNKDIVIIPQFEEKKFGLYFSLRL